MTTPLDIARNAWGADLPEWVEALAIECGKTSQSRVATQMNRSGALISNVLRNKYPGSLSAVEEVFSGVFQHALLDCPALGNIPTNQCQDWRRKSHSFATGNPLRTRMFRACGQCPRNRKGATA